MINVTKEFVADKLVENYEKQARADGLEIEQFVFRPGNKKVPHSTYFLNVDNCIREFIKENNMKNGVIVCSSRHTTSSVYVNHFERGLLVDLNNLLTETYPAKKKYEHNLWDDVYKNADAHLKAIYLGKSVTVMVIDGELVLGDFENIIYAEFDERPGKSFAVTLIGE